MVARFLDQKLNDRRFTPPPRETALGSLLTAITDEFKKDHFQPTNINFGLLPPWPEDLKDKKQKKTLQIERAKTALKKLIP